MEMLATGFAFLEAPRYDGEGGLYFVDDKTIFHLDSERRISVVADRPAGGVLLHRDGGIVVSGATIVHLQPGEEPRDVLVLEDVEWINDIYADDHGRVYAGSIPNGPGGDTDASPPGCLWRIDATGHAEVLYEDVGFTNGIGFSPDGGVLFHSDTLRRELIVHDIVGDAVTSRRALSTAAVTGGPDGLAVDRAGFVWVAMYGGGCIARFDPEGGLERVIELPAVNVTSVAFGGCDGGELYVVTCDNTDSSALRGCIYRLEPPEAGLVAPRAAV